MMRVIPIRFPESDKDDNETVISSDVFDLEGIDFFCAYPRDGEWLVAFGDVACATHDDPEIAAQNVIEGMEADYELLRLNEAKLSSNLAGRLAVLRRYTKRLCLPLRMGEAGTLNESIAGIFDANGEQLFWYRRHESWTQRQVDEMVDHLCRCLSGEGDTFGEPDAHAPGERKES